MTTNQHILRGSAATTEDSRSADTDSHDRLDGRRSDEVRSTGAPVPRCAVPASLPGAFFRSPSARSVPSPATVQSVVLVEAQR